MKVLVIGATGFVGGGLVRAVSRRHEVVGLARTDAGAARLESAGIEVLRGDLAEGLDAIVESVRHVDAVVFAPQLDPEVEHRVVTALLAATHESACFLFVSGTGVLLQRTEGAWSDDSFAEDDPFTPEVLAARRVETELLVRSSHSRGFVLRPPSIWGTGDHGVLTMIYRSVAVTGAACYVGSGFNSQSNVHLDDVSDLAVSILERGVPGALYHAVGGETATRWSAEAVARDLGCSTRSVSMDEANAVWGEFGALLVASSSRSRSPRARSELGWHPRLADMHELIGEPWLRALSQRV